MELLMETKRMSNFRLAVDAFGLLVSAAVAIGALALGWLTIKGQLAISAPTSFACMMLALLIFTVYQLTAQAAIDVFVEFKRRVLKSQDSGKDHEST